MCLGPEYQFNMYINLATDYFRLSQLIDPSDTSIRLAISRKLGGEGRTTFWLLNTTQWVSLEGSTVSIFISPRNKM